MEPVVSLSRDHEDQPRVLVKIRATSDLRTCYVAIERGELQEWELVHAEVDGVVFYNNDLLLVLRWFGMEELLPIARMADYPHVQIEFRTTLTKT